jgi:hypothetical protein
LGYPEDEQEVITEICGTPQGGVIACGEAGPDVPLADILAMYEAFCEFLVL